MFIINAHAQGGGGGRNGGGGYAPRREVAQMAADNVRAAGGSASRAQRAFNNVMNATGATTVMDLRGVGGRRVSGRGVSRAARAGINS